MTKWQRTVAIIITILCLSTILARIFYPCLLVDQQTIWLLALGSLPWLTLFFKKFNIPGILEGETHDRTQGMTEKPIPPNINIPLDQSKNTFSLDAQKILATLWRYQRQHFKDDTSKRWTFVVFPNATDYPSYLTGVAELLKSGLIAVIPGNYQVLLTDEGMNYVQNHKNDIESYSNIYAF